MQEFMPSKINLFAFLFLSFSFPLLIPPGTKPLSGIKRTTISTKWIEQINGLRGVDHLLPYINMLGSIIFLQNLPPEPHQLNSPAEIRNATLTSPSQLVNYLFFFFWRQLPDTSTERLNTQELLAHMFSTHTIKEAGLYRMTLPEKSKEGQRVLDQVWVPVALKNLQVLFMVWMFNLPLNHVTHDFNYHVLGSS